MTLLNSLMACIVLALASPLFAQVADVGVNDEPERAPMINGIAGVEIEDSTIGASDSPLDTNPNGVGSVWFRYVPQYSGPVKFVPLLGSPSVWVYRTNASSPRGVLLMEKDVTDFYLHTGVLYYFSVYTPADARGTFRFRIELNTAPPVNDDFENAIRIPTQIAPVTVQGSAFAATRQAGDPAIILGEPPVWYRWRAPATGRVVLKALHGSGIYFFKADGSTASELTAVGDERYRPVVQEGEDYYLAVCQRLPLPALINFEISVPAPTPPNDDFENAIVVEPLDGWLSMAGTLAGSGRVPGEPSGFQEGSIGSVWYKWIVTQPTRIGGFTTVSGSADCVLLKGESFASLTYPHFALVQPGTHYIRVYDKGAGLGSFSVKLKIVGPTAANDLFANALTISGAVNHVTSSTWLGSLETGEPDPYRNGGGGCMIPVDTLWWKYVVEESGLLISHDYPRWSGPSHAIYKGTSLQSLLPLGCVAQAPKVTAVNAGETIYFQAESPFAVRAVPSVVSNDNFASATLLEGPQLEVLGHNVGATRESGEPAAATGAGASVWYAWIAPYDGEGILNVDVMRGSVSVFRGSSLGDLTLEPHPIKLIGGRKYFIRMESSPSDAGGFLFTIQTTSLLPPNDAFASATWLKPFTTGTAIGDATMKLATSEPGEPAHIPGPQKTVWWKWRPDQTGEGEFNVNIHGGGRGTGAVYQGSSLQTLRNIAKGQTTLTFPVYAGETYYVVAVGPPGFDAFIYCDASSRAQPLPPQSQNVIQNGEFTDGGAHWTISSPALVAFQNIFGEDFFASMNGPATLAQTVTVAAGKTYNVRFSGRAMDSQNAARIAVRWQGVQLGYLEGKLFEHQWFEAEVTALSSSATLALESLGGAIRVDSIRISPASSDAPFIDDSDISSRQVRVGTPLTFNVSASGGEPLRYEWFKNGNILNDQNSAQLSIANVTQSDAGEYYVRVSNASGSVTSDQGTVAVVDRLSQVIDFAPLGNFEGIGASLSLEATSSSGLPVSFSVDSGPGSIAGNLLTASGVGLITITATQGGNDAYHPAAPVTQTIEFRKRSQTITLIIELIGNERASVSATSSSGLPVITEVLSGPGILQNGVLSATGSGAISVAASQSGNEQFEPAQTVQQSVVLRRFPQSIDFGTDELREVAITTAAPLNGQVLLQAAASSGLAVHFEIVSGPGLINGNILTLTGMDDVIVKAVQPGNNMHLPASVERTYALMGGKPRQKITFTLQDVWRFGDDLVFLAAQSSSGLKVSFNVVSGQAVIHDDALIPLGTGPLTLRASQDGNEVFAAATPVERTITVAKQVQTIVFPQLPTIRVGSSPVALNVKTTAGLPAELEIISGPGALTGNSLSIIGPGIISIVASHPGDGLREPAPRVTNEIEVLKLAQTIDFPLIAAISFGAGDVELKGSASSGLPVEYEVLSGPATLEARSLRPTGAGVVHVRLTQPGNAVYQAASPFEAEVVISKANQAITFSPIADVVFGTSPIQLRAEATSGLPIKFEVVSGAAILAGDILTVRTAGVVKISATQAGNTNYHEALEVEQSFTVTRANQTIEFTVPASLGIGSPPLLLTPTASSGLPVAVSVLSGSAGITNGLLTLNTAGEVVLEASQSGDLNFEPAPSVRRTIEVVGLPRVNLGISTNGLALTWPKNAVGFEFESAINLSGPWETMTLSAEELAAGALTIQFINTQRYFRLKTAR
jgi:hypothetical protein